MAVFPPLRALPFNATTLGRAPFMNVFPFAHDADCSRMTVLIYLHCAPSAAWIAGPGTRPESWILTFLGKAPPQAAAKQVTHPECGAMTFETIVETMAGHDLNHLGQLQKLATATA
jgi:hypothetical protein